MFIDSMTGPALLMIVEGRWATDAVQYQSGGSRRHMPPCLAQAPEFGNAVAHSSCVRAEPSSSLAPGLRSFTESS